MYKILYEGELLPNYCTKCRKSLIITSLAAGYDAYTGEDTLKTYRACPDAVKALLDTYHDVWELKKGASIQGFGLQTVKTF